MSCSSLVIVQLAFSIWWDFQYLQTSTKDLAQNIIYSPWEGTKDPWLCLMTELLFCLVWLLSFASAFSSLIKFILCLKFFLMNKRQAKDRVLKRPHRVLLSYKPSGWLSLHLHLLAMRFHSVVKIRGNQHPNFPPPLVSTGSGRKPKVHKLTWHQSIQFSSVTQSCPALCDPMNRSTPGLPVHHQLSESTQTCVHCVSDANQPSHTLLSLLLLSSIFPSIRIFSNDSALHMRWPKYWSFSFNISPSIEHPGLISFRMDWLDLLAVQRTLKSLLQHHSSKASILLCSAFFIVQLSHPYMGMIKTVGGRAT